MQKLLLPILLLLGCPAAMVLGQTAPQRCDSNYVELFSKGDFDDNHVPCDTFVVMGRDYYERVAIGYNLRGDIVRGQAKVIDNLAVQLQLARERNDTMQAIINLTEATLGRYRTLADNYEQNLQQSLDLNSAVIDSTREVLTLLRQEHRKELRSAKVKNFLLGGVIGAFVGFIAGLVLLNR